jgi:ATP-dependent exoDNAse (exonuclease V) beta subunit
LPPANAIRLRRGNYGRRLETSGVPAERLEAAVERVIEALVRTREDARGRWIFSESHHDARSELGLTGHADGELSRIVIDRTFVTEDGERWIIDFKTSSHEGGEGEAFLDREVERYRPQLEHYARLLAPDRAFDLHVGLYFPLIGGWREWTARAGSVGASE